MSEVRVQRRLAAILAADVVGYSRLVRDDEEATLSSVASDFNDVFLPRIDRSNGRVFKTMGDGLFAEFPSVVDAVRCAVDIQDAMGARNDGRAEDRKIQFRIGINLGDVVADGDDLQGDGVNVAARLESFSEPNGIWISSSAHEQVRDKLAMHFEDQGEKQAKNIDRPIRAFRVTKPGEAGQDGSRSGSAGQRVGWRLPTIASLILLIAIGGGLLVWRPWIATVEPASVQRMALPLPDKPSIAVLPFNNMSDDPDQEYFADGMTEDLITDLSKVSGLFIIARNSVFTYKNKPVKIQQVAEELGVRYVLEGSVRRSGQTVRINAQLIDAMTGGHLWAERYDGTLANVFSLQDQVTGQIVAALAVKLAPDEAKPPAENETNSPQAYDAFLQGWELYRQDTPERYAEALQFFERAVDLDPGYDRAWAAMASVYWKSYQEDWATALSISRHEAWVKARELIAGVSGKSLPLAYQLASQVSLWRGDYPEAISSAEQAVSGNPNDSTSQIVLAEALIFGGRPDAAVAIIDSARRHDPLNEARYVFLEGLAQFGTEQFAAAADSFERTLALNPELWNPEGDLGRAYCQPCVALIAAYGHLGRRDDAVDLIERVKKDWPGFQKSPEVFLRPFPLFAGPEFERFRSGLKKAGVTG